MTTATCELDWVIARMHWGMLASAPAGFPGIAPTANFDPERRFPSMFEPIQGSAFDIAGKGIARSRPV